MTLPKQVMNMKRGLVSIHKITPKQKLEASDTAKKRRDLHRELKSRKHWDDPNKGEYADEVFGNLGNIVWRDTTNELQLGNDRKFAPLFVRDMSSLPEWDSKIDSHTIEIKTVPPDGKVKRRLILLKLSEFKQLDYYVAVRFLDDEYYIFCGWESGKSVVKWPVRNFGYADAYYHPWDDLNILDKYKLFDME